MKLSLCDFVCEVVPALGFCQFAGSFSRMQWLRSLLCVVTVDICSWYRQMWSLCLLYLAPQELASLFSICLPTLGRECCIRPLLHESYFMGCLPFICMDIILLMWLKVSGQKVRRTLPWCIFCITRPICWVGCKHGKFCAVSVLTWGPP